ncbi:MAG: minor capsid protein [Prevotellaceae bacterium]|jgi:SPP1 gp7 family putative phage head morphogenesis protein|nr:minor capsid protein [Prevotellaceae bacterium]
MDAINSGLGGSSFNYDDSRNILKNLMYDKKTGEIRNFTDFRQALVARGKRFNQAYLKTEYDTALQSAIMAHKWDTLTSEYLEFSTVGDNRVRPEHAILDRKTFPKNDGFWDTYYPPLSWNCRCTVVPGLAQNYNPNKDFTKTLKIKPLFVPNIGKTRVVFSNSHPYFTIAKKDMTYNRYGMQEVEQIRCNPHNLPQMATVADKQAYFDWWAKQAKFKNDDIAVTDILGQSILFESHEGKSHSSSKYFKHHILRKPNEQRERYAVNFRDILEKPHEVWDYLSKDGKTVNKTFYIKYYQTETVVVVVDNKTLTADTMYSLNSNERINQLRKGLLKYKSSR